MAYATRLALGIIFIVVNVLLFGVAALQINRSAKLFHDFSGYRTKLGIRSLNLWGTTLLVLLALIDTDFWIFDSDQPPSVSEGVFYLYIVIKALCDITLCVTGSVIILSLIRIYYVTNLGDPEFPGHITTFWAAIASSFSFIVFVCVVVTVAAQQWVAVVVYSAIRLLYLFLAALYLAYTYYWVFYVQNRERVHFRNSILLLLFAFCCFAGCIYLFVRAFTVDHTLESVVSARLNRTDISPAEYAGGFVVVLLGWLGYWYVMSWYIKFAWTNSVEVESRDLQTARQPHSGSATAV